MRSLAMRLNEVVKESEFYLYNSKPSVQETVLNVLQESVTELSTLQTINLQKDETIARLKEENARLSNDLRRERQTKADRSIEEKELLQLVQRAKELMGPCAYSSYFVNVDSHRQKTRTWLKDLASVFIKFQFPFKEEV